MRILPALALLLIAACSEPAPPGTQEAGTEAPDPTTPQNPDAALLDAAPQSGQWVFNADAGIFAAGFGAPNSEFQLVVSCEQPTRKITVMSAHELAPDQDTALDLIFDASTLSVPARSFNEGLPHVAAEMDGEAEAARSVANMLSEERAHFGVRIGGETHVYPWDDSLSRALSACR